MSDAAWLPFYGDIPPHLDYPNKTLYAQLIDAAKAQPDGVAVSFLGARVSYRTLRTLVERAAQALWALGIRPEDRVATVLPNTPHAFVILYAANRVGALVSFLHPELDSARLSAHLTDFAPHWIFVNDDHLEGVRRIARPIPVRGMVVCGLIDFAPPGRVRRHTRFRKHNALDRGGVRGAAARASDEPAPTFSWESFLQLAPAGGRIPPQKAVHLPEAPAMVIYSGGSTGTLHGALHTDRQLVALACQTQVQGPLLAGQRLVCTVPYALGYGAGVGIHSCVTAAAESIVVPHFTPRSLARLLRREHPEYLVGMPHQYETLVRDRLFRRSRHSSLMGAFCGGDRLPATTHRLFAEIVRRRGGAVTIREGYGLCETVAACATMPEGYQRPGSVGIPYPDMLIRIAQPRAGQEDDAGEPSVWLGANETGEICVSGPTVMEGYWRQGGGAESSLASDAEGRRWLRTGDLGRMDGDGFLTFVERSGRFSSIGSAELYPGLTEVVLNQLSLVYEACVTLAPGPAGQRLRAHVVPADRDADSAWLVREIAAACAEALPESLQPEVYDLRSELPRTLSGGVDFLRLTAEVLVG